MRIYSLRNTSSRTITTTTETAVDTSPGVSVDSPGRTVVILAIINVTTGAGTTLVTVRVYRGATIVPANIINITDFTASGGSLFRGVVATEDVPGDVMNQQYLVTVQQAGATGNGTISYSELVLMQYP